MFQYMRLVRHGRANLSSLSACSASRHTSASAVVIGALCLASAALLLHAPPARAADEIVIDGQADNIDLSNAAGMPASNPRVAGILAAHPNQFVVVCVAGCDGKPKAVQVLPMPEVRRSGEVRPSSADMSKSSYGPPRPIGAKVNESDDVVCLAGCTERTGQVLQRFADLPPVQRRAAKKTDEDKDTPEKQKSGDDSIWDDLIP